MRWAQVSVCVLASFIFPNWQSFVWNYFRMRTVHWTGIHIHCSMSTVFNVRLRLPEAVFPLRQSCKSGRAFRAGLRLKFFKMFRADFAFAYKISLYIKSNDFFLSWRTFVGLTTELLWVKWLWFLQLILFASTAAFFSSLLGLASNSFWEGYSGKEISTRWLCVEKINHSRDVCLF